MSSPQPRTYNPAFAPALAKASTGKQKLKTIFIGTSDFAVPILESLITNGYPLLAIITAPDKPIGRKQILTPPPVKISALKYGIPVLQPEILTNFKSEILNSKPDLIVVAAYGRILPKEILEIPKYGSLNIHPSLLPKYRGPSPIQYAILNGETETGVSIILMNEKIDAGSILGRLNLRGRFNLQKLNHKELEKELSELGAKLLIETVPKWINGKIKPRPQDDSRATYTKIFTRDDGKIEWKKPAKDIERQIRALNPEPGAYTQLTTNDKQPAIKTLKIIKADVLPIKIKRQPGEVFLTEDKKLAISCGEDALILEEIQPEGKRKITGQDFLRGHQDFLGSTLI